MKKLLIVVMACYGLNARSQENGSQNFIKLYSDSTVYAQKIRLRPDVAGTLSLRADGRRIPIAQVKFFNSDDGFYANTKQFNLLGQVSLAERIIEGKINLYQEVNYNYNAYEMDYNRFRNRSPQVISTRMYFNKGMDDLQKVNYTNLSTAMADNRKSIDLLEGYRKSMRTGTIMYVSAGAAIIAGAATLLSGSGFKQNGTMFGGRPSFESKSFTGSFLLLGLGTGLGLGGYLVQASGARNIEKAVEVYNR